MRHCSLESFYFEGLPEAAALWTLYLQVAYPFYNVDKETFLLFYPQILDLTVSLLPFDT